MANFSFDIVSEVDLQEMDNAVNQANKELAQRYDFKDSKASENRIFFILSDNAPNVFVRKLNNKLIKSIKFSTTNH